MKTTFYFIIVIILIFNVSWILIFMNKVGNLKVYNLYVKLHSRPMKVKVKVLSHVRLFATPWTVAYQAPPSMGFSRQEYWSGLPFPSPGDLPNPGIEPWCPAFQADALTSELPGIQCKKKT